MTLNNWTVRTVSGCAGGLSREARVTLEVNCTSDTVEEVRQLAEAAPEMLTALQDLEEAISALPEHEEGLPFSLRGPVAVARTAIAKATREQ